METVTDVRARVTISLFVNTRKVTRCCIVPLSLDFSDAECQLLSCCVMSAWSIIELRLFLWLTICGAKRGGGGEETCSLCTLFSPLERWLPNESEEKRSGAESNLSQEFQHFNHDKDRISQWPTAQKVNHLTVTWFLPASKDGDKSSSRLLMQFPAHLLLSLNSHK